MSKFFRDAIVFLLPLGVIFLLPYIILRQSGEFTPIPEVIARQGKSEVLFGRAYQNSTLAFKHDSLSVRRPTVLALGTSRVMQFRKEFFKENASFYNAGGAISSIQELDTFYASLPSNYQPSLIILGLDQNFFNPSYYAKNNAPHPRIKERLFQNFITYGWRQAYVDFFKGKIPLRRVFAADRASTAIGLNALVKHNGFRSDGSYYYGEDMVDTEHATKVGEGIDFALQALHSPEGYYLYGERVEPKAVLALENFLAESAKRGVHVVGFLPPFAHRVYEALEEDPRFHQSVSKLPQELKSVFAKKNFIFYDASNNSHYNSSDTELIDAVHGSEKTYLRLFQVLSKNDAQLRMLTDTVMLEKRLQATTSSLAVFPEHVQY